MHEGTLRVQRLVKERNAEYESKDRIGKTRIAESIVRFVHEQGGRFLIRNDDRFLSEPRHHGNHTVAQLVEASHSQAREKVSRYFRKLRPPKVNRLST